jgi:hypothetical protein
VRPLTLATALLVPALAIAAGEHHHDSTPTPNDPPIRITINPEARVSVKLGGDLPPPTACGKAADLTVKILNQGFVTARLEAQLVEASAGVTLDLDSEPLTGVSEELRTLRITLTRPGPIDITVSFKARNHTPDLGGRDRIHFIMRCIV